MPDARAEAAILPELRPESFPEELYLTAFSDVRDAVAAGMLSSAYEHYALSGRSEIQSGLRPNPFLLVPGAVSAANGARPTETQLKADASPSRRAPSDDPPPGRAATPPAVVGPRQARQQVRGGDRRRSQSDRRTVVEPAAAAPPPERRDEPAADPSPPTPRRRDATALLGPPETAEEGLFDADIYLAVNPDVAAAIASGRVPDARQHWQRLGRDEERRGLRPSILRETQFEAAPPLREPAPELEGFDTEGYLFANPDVRKVIGTNPAAAAAHWRDHGRIEGRVRRGVAANARRRADALAVLARPFGLNVFGPFAAATGLGTASRNLVRALRAAGLPFELFPFDVQTGTPRLPAAEARHRPRYRINLILANADQMAALVGIYPDGTFDDAYTIGLWAWELAAFRPDWFECFGAVDEVWTNSAFEVEAIAAVSPVPVTKVRLPVLAQVGDSEEGRAAFGVPARHFVFLVAFDVGSTSARKNPRLAVEAFREAFGPDDPVFLVIKFHSNSLEPQVTREVSQALRGASNVLVVAERISEAEMSLLRACADCYVSAHRAEGYGLNIAEFMALGRPVIATGYSGNREFLDETTGYPIGYTLCEIGAHAGPYLPHYVWAEPDRASLVAAMRQVVADPAEAARRGAAGAERMANDFGPAVIGRQIMQRLSALGLDQPVPSFLGLLGRTSGLRLPALLGEHEPAELRAIAALGERRPLFSVLLTTDGAAERLSARVAAMLIQTYPLWEVVLVIADPAPEGPSPLLERLRGWDPRVRLRHTPADASLAERLMAAAEMSTGDWVVLITPGDVPAPNALLAFAEALQPGARPAEAPPLDALYADSHLVEPSGDIVGHAFRPDLSPELLEASAYAGSMLAVRKAALLGLVAEAADGSWTGGAVEPARDEPVQPHDLVQQEQDACAYALLLALLRRKAAIGHVAKPLYQSLAARLTPIAPLEAVLRRHAALAYGEAATVQPGRAAGTFRLRRPFGARPRVALLLTTVPAGEPGAAARRVQAALAALLPDGLADTDVVLVGDVALAGHLPSQVRVLETEPGSGFAARANLALRQARAEHVVVLGCLPTAADPGWLDALLEPLQDPDVGIVGGRLIGPDGGTLQGAAMLSAKRPVPLRPTPESGYDWLDQVVRNVSAIGAACLASRRSVLGELGGFLPSLPTGLAVADLCVRAAASAYRIVDTPFAQLHGEGTLGPEPDMHWDVAERYYNPAFRDDGSYRLT